MKQPILVKLTVGPDVLKVFARAIKVYSSIVGPNYGEPIGYSLFEMNDNSYAQRHLTIADDCLIRTGHIETAPIYDTLKEAQEYLTKFGVRA